ncbi:DNA-deoxyinosine glycosylase [Polaribacter sp.]|nr:DNA-deoxyinosine glycosylase [Polaribacter sp.]
MNKKEQHNIQSKLNEPSLGEIEACSFNPVIPKKPEVLILGTMPGKKSLELQQYYGHKQNAFWKIIYQLFNGELEEDYQKRIFFAKSKHVAIWDNCKFAERKSSLDSDIKNEIPNPINQLLVENPTIKKVGFNGKKSEKLYTKYFEPIKGVEYLTLLSTSPANARFTFEEKLDNWKQIKG